MRGNSSCVYKNQTQVNTYFQCRVVQWVYRAQLISLVKKRGGKRAVVSCLMAGGLDH